MADLPKEKCPILYSREAPAIDSVEYLTIVAGCPVYATCPTALVATRVKDGAIMLSLAEVMPAPPIAPYSPIRKLRIFA